MRRFACLLVLVALLGGCTVGPTYKPPETGMPVQFAEARPAGDQPASADLEGWWKSYQDPELDRLVDIALAESPDLKAATARIAQARAQVRAARAQTLPQVNASAGAEYLRFSKNAGLSSLASLFGGGSGSSAGSGSGSGSSSSGIAAPGDAIEVYSVGFDASWEIDLFGGGRRGVEAAVARTDAAIWSARDVRLSLVAELVDHYLQFRTLQQREAIARAEIDRGTGRLAMMQHRSQVGLSPEGDFVRERADLAQSRAALQPILAEGGAQVHSVAVLIGRTPEAMLDELAVKRRDLQTPPAVPAGLPSDLLRRRPDIRAAERRLAAATADIGVAVAELYPRFSLTGLADLISTSLGNLFTRDSLQLTSNAKAIFPILDFGKRKAIVAARRAQADEAYADYQRVVLNALRDVDDALIRVHTEQRHRAEIVAGLADATRAAGVAESRYEAGLADFTTVLDARRLALADQDLTAQSDGQLRRAILSLYKALGGGWQS